MEAREAVFVVPVEFNDEYGTHFILLGHRTKEGTAKGKLIPPMGRRENLRFFGKRTPIRESWEKRAMKELYEESGGSIDARDVEYVGSMIDSTYEPNTRWKIRIFAAYNPKVSPFNETLCKEIKVVGWYDTRLLEYLKETGQINDTTYIALKMVKNWLKT